MEKQTSYSHILKYIGLFGSVQGLSVMINVVRTKLVALILGPHGMGMLSLFSSSISFLENSTNLGIPMSGVKEVSAEYNSLNEDALIGKIKVIRSWGLLTALFGMILCVVLSPMLDRFMFDEGEHTLQFILLSPIVAMTAITGCETAILKATRQLRKLATATVYGVFVSLFLSVPLYYEFGVDGIVPSLVLVTLAQMAITLWFSCRIYPWHFSLDGDTLRKGFDFVKLGIAFVLAGIAGSGSEMVVRSFLNHIGQQETVGLYNACYVLIFTYAGMLFSAMETDFFPRLSSVSGVGKELNDMVNNQIEASLLIVSPMVVLFIVAMPILLPLLYSGKFVPVIEMTQIAALSLYMRTLYLSVEYIPLSKGDSMTYFSMEFISAIILISTIVLGYYVDGLFGAGCAMTIGSVVEYIVVASYYRFRYKYIVNASVIKFLFMQFPLGALAFFLALYCSSVAYWILGSLLFIGSLALSLFFIHKKTDLWQKINRRLNFKI